MKITGLSIGMQGKSHFVGIGVTYWSDQVRMTRVMKYW